MGSEMSGFLDSFQISVFNNTLYCVLRKWFKPWHAVQT